MKNKESYPLVSVLMTAYNREKYIAEAIESVISSTYQNWELIIVDDQSKDRTVEIARSYEVKDDRIKVYINEKNLGDYPNRNKAASYAKGKYLKYLDADDLLYPHALEVFVGDLEKYPTAGLALSKPDNTTEPLPIFLKSREAIREHFLTKNFLTNSPLGALIKKEAFLNVGGFSGKRHVGDSELWVKIANRYDVIKTVMGLGFWRSHEQQESLIGKKNINSKIKRYKTNLELIEACQDKFSSDELAGLQNRAQKEISRYFFHLLKHNQYKKAQQLKSELETSFTNLFRNSFFNETTKRL